MKVIYRIKDTKDFLLTIRKGRAFNITSYVVHISNNKLGHSRVGISVSAKLGNAVIRNKVKRQIRAMTRDLLDFENTSFDIVIIAKPPYFERNFEDNKQILSDFLKSQVGTN